MNPDENQMSQMAPQPEIQTPEPIILGSAVEMPPTVWWKRFLENLIDGITIALCTAIVSGVLGMLGTPKGVVTFLSYVIMLAYYWIMETVWQRTVGKMAFGTKVVDYQGGKPSAARIFGRSAARYIPFDGLSFLSKNPIGWHDSLSKTLVVPVDYTPEQVVAIDKTKHRAGALVIILIGIFLVVTILGIISAVVLASLNAAREHQGAGVSGVSTSSAADQHTDTYFQ